MINIALVALVTGVSPDGLYLDEGADDGVRLGDVVTIVAAGTQKKLAIVELAPHRSRTGPLAAASEGTATPPSRAESGDLFTIRVGSVAAIRKTGAPRRAPAVAKLQPAPKLDPAQAPILWAAAEDGWATPRASGTPTLRPAPAAQAETWRLRGDLSLTTSHVALLDGSQSTSIGTLGSDLEARRGRFLYAHDLRFNAGLPTDEVHESHPYVEPRQLEVGWDTGRWGARGGRLADTDRLASGPVDGAAFRVSSPGEGLHLGGQVYGGLVPALDTLEPSLRDRTVGLAGEAGGQAAGLRIDASLGANAIARDTALARVVAGPQLTVTGDAWSVLVFADTDWKPAFTLSQLYASAYGALTSHLDLGLRYGRQESPAFAYEADGVRQDAWLDARLDFYPAGTFFPRLGYLNDSDGDTWLPGLDYRVAVTRSLDALAGYEYARGPWQESHQGRARLTWRLDTRFLAELDVGGRGTLVYPFSGPGGTSDATDDFEKTGELGAWLRLPADFDLHLYAEGTMAWQNRVVALADLRWRFTP